MRLIPVLAATLLSVPALAVDVTFQLVNSGYVLDGAELPVNNPAAPMQFKMFSTSAPIDGERTLWSGTATVVIANGFYSTTLGTGDGAGIPASLFTGDSNVYLDITLSEKHLLPRLRIGAVPLAANALSLGGRTAGDFALKTDVDAKIATFTSDTTNGLASKASASDLAALRSAMYSKTEVDAALALKADASKLSAYATTAALEQAVAPLATQSALEAAVAPLATKTATQTALDAAVAPLATKAALTAAVAPLATTAALNTAISTLATTAVLSVPDASTFSIDGSAANVFDITMLGNRTMGNPANQKNGATYTFRIRQDGTGSRTLAWGSSYLFGGVSSGLSDAANSLTIFTFHSDGTRLYATGAYSTTPQCAAGTQTLNFTGSIVNFTMPQNCRTLTIEAWGARGGYGTTTYNGGFGAYIKGTVTTTGGATYRVLVGGKGGDHAAQKSGGGGGGTFVTDLSNNPVVIAGGGGGGGGNSNPATGQAGQTSTAGGAVGGAAGGTNGSGGSTVGGSNGGAGLTGNGGLSSCATSSQMTAVPQSFINGGAGGQGGTCPAGGGAGGFGGGSGGEWCCQGAPGSGGGYSGGGGVNSAGIGAGGGSYNAGSNQTNTSGVDPGTGGNGKVVFSYAP